MIVMGGSDGHQVFSTTQIVMPGSSTRYGPQMREVVAGHCSVSLDDKVMVTGGSRYKQQGGSDVAEMMNINTGEWEDMAKMNYPRAYHTCTTVWLNQDNPDGDIFNKGVVDNSSVLSLVVAGGKY